MECLFTLGFVRWAWKRCTYTGSDDSASWAEAIQEEFEPVPRICRIILAVYEQDLNKPQYSPENGYRLNLEWIVKRVTYEQTLGRAPPYIIYLDHEHKDIILAIRGLNLIKESDYKLLLDNRLGMQMFDGGFVHHGLLKSANWLLDQEGETLRRLWEENGKEYNMVFSGHSLGSGVAALLTVIVVNHRNMLGGIPREKIRMISSQELPLHWKISLSQSSGVDNLNSLPCLLFLVCLRDTFIPEDRKRNDPRRLYVPGRMYHVVERKFCRRGRFPPEVRTAIPVDGRFEHIVLSCNATSDHGIVWIERESERALLKMKETKCEIITTAPIVQKLDRMETLGKEHKDALERAVSLNIPNATNALDAEKPQTRTSLPKGGSEDASQDAQK